MAESRGGPQAPPLEPFESHRVETSRSGTAARRRGGRLSTMKPRVYIETTIPSFYFETRSTPEMVARRQWTRHWWVRGMGSGLNTVILLQSEPTPQA